MKRLLVLVCALFAAAVLAGSAMLAVAGGKKTEVHHVQGQVTSVDTTAKTFSIQEKLSNGQTKDVTFAAEEKMKVTIHGKKGKLDEVKAGDSIRVRYVSKGTVQKAEEIAIVGAP